jgi:hypothetical protein
MGKVANSSPAVAHSVPVVLWSVVLSLAAACTGSLDGAAGPSDHFDDPSQVGDGAPPPGIDSPTFLGPIVSAPAPASRFVRLSHRQWENTVRDALYLPEPLGLSRAFVAEPLRGTFDTNGSILTVSQDMGRDYQTAAEKIAALVARDAERLLALAPDDGTDEATRSRRFVEDFGLRVFRRPLSEAEVSDALALFAKGPSLVNSGDAFADGVELVVSYFFQSPNFLYRTELGQDVQDGKILLSSYEIASRLSYGLTNTMPDDALFGAARSDELRETRGVRAAAERLVSSEAARLTFRDYHEQLLNMREYESVSRDPGQFPGFAEGVGADLKQETLTFVDHVVATQKLGLEELLTAPYTFVNRRIAELYGIAVPAEAQASDAFVRVDLDPSQRAGMLTQIGFLSTHGEGNTPNSIMRGVNVAHRILCSDLPPPPMMVPALPPIEPGGTNRDRVAKLTETAACSACHTNIINPLGFAFEKLDGVGLYRSEENGIAIDATGTFNLDGKKVSYDGAVELAQSLAASKQAHDCYARHWVEYLYGRDVVMAETADKYLVQQAGTISRNQPSVQKLLVELVSTDAFLTRSPSN